MSNQPTGYERIHLTINGVDRPVVCDPQKDTLATVIRRMGLTGTKVGCGIGVCGACSIVLNGELCRSCNKKMKNVPEYSEIITIEGIGTPQHLHPIQQAWITYGGTQCGFCTPGFIVSAYVLLQKNPSPTREDVRDWFQKNHNICRCTGYKPLIDAVMAAAKVMRGEATVESITYDFEGETEIYGSSRPRPSAVAKVCGLTDYGDDIALKMPGGMAYLAVTLAAEPHAKILSIDTSEAEKMPGIIKVMTAADVKGNNNIDMPPIIPRWKGTGTPPFPVIAGDKVCRKGDVVALVAADTEAHARAAAAAVKQELEILPSYFTYPEACMPNAIQMHETCPNSYMEAPLHKGEDPEEIFDEAAYVVEGSFHSQREPHLPIEPDVCQGYYDTDGNIVVQCKTQAVGEGRESVAQACGIPMDKLRLIGNPVGGSFGYSVTANTYALATTAVQNLGIPVTLSLSYEEFIHMSGKRSATYTNGKLACDENGKLVAAEFDIGLDHGAYAGMASKIFNNLISVPFNGYSIPNVKALARGGVSNHAFNAAYRGFGAPQVYTFSEALMDMLAEKAGIDPWQFRYQNLAGESDTTINNRPYKAHLYKKLLEMLKPHYDEFKAEAEKGRADGRNMGVGISLGGFLCTLGMWDKAEVALELMPDGMIGVYNTWEDMGQGGDIGTLTVTVKALEKIGIKPEQVRLVMNDSHRCPDSGVAAASRSHFMNGRATIAAAEQLMAAMKKPDGTLRTYAEMVAEGIPTKYIGHDDLMNKGIDPGLNPNTGEGDKDGEWMYGVNTALVEVNVNTGKTKVLRYASCVDIGVIGNKLAVDGQAYGGISHSIGFALSEDYQDIKRHRNMIACGIPQIQDIPDDIRVEYSETPRPLGPFGSSGCSEVFQSSGHMAVINAIKDATGCRIYELPATPDKVKAALAAKQNGQELKPAKYYLGPDMEDVLDDIAGRPM